MKLNIDDLIQVATGLFREGRLMDATAAVQKVLYVQPLHGEALHLLGLICNQKGEHKAAVVHIKSAIQVKPSAHMHFNLGRILYNQKKMNAAENSFRRALELKPDFIQAMQKLSQLQLQMNDTDAALASISNWVNIKPEAAAYHSLGVVLASRGQRDAAVDAYQKAISFKTDGFRTYNNLGILLRQKGKLAAAADCFQRSLDNHPDYLPPAINLGLVYKIQNRLEAAADCFSQAVSVNPRHAPAHNYLGQTFRLQGKLDASVRSHQRAITHAFENPSPPTLPRKTLVTDQAQQVLLIARQRMIDANIVFFLCAGTLLGIIREGDLLPFDKDMDLGVPWEVDRHKILTALTADDEFYYPGAERMGRSEKSVREQRLISLVHKRTGITLDMFFFQPAGKYYLCGFDQKPTPILCKPRRFELAPLIWKGVQWMVPSDCNQYLTDMYGPDWRIPDPSFDTVVSNFCPTPESKEGRRCFGYDRLFTRLQSQQLEKAAGYCRQLLTLGEDPFLTRLLEKIHPLETEVNGCDPKRKLLS